MLLVEHDARIPTHRRVPLEGFVTTEFLSVNTAMWHIVNCTNNPGVTHSHSRYCTVYKEMKVNRPTFNVQI
jgi:hypothetical protein